MATTTQSMDVKRSSPAGLWMAALLVLALAGIGAYIYQLIQGMGVTGLDQQVVWGLYIAGFFTAIAAGAGLLALRAVSVFIPLFTPQSRLRILTLSLASFIAGGLLIAMDVGNPLQLWRVVTALRFSSLLTWDFWLLAVAALIALVDLLGGARQSKLLAGIEILAALAVVGAEGGMLSTLAARTLWAGGATLFSFLLSALIAGFALAIIALPKTQRLVPALAITLVANLLLVGAEVLVAALSQDARTVGEIYHILVGQAAPAFWLHLVAGLLLPLGLLLFRTAPEWAAGLAILGIVAEKAWLLEAGLIVPWVLPVQGGYSATWPEYLALIGVVSLVALVYLLVNRSTKVAD
jgi:molybdopterin-containing oxidoreductase family membrane subunit